MATSDSNICWVKAHSWGIEGDVVVEEPAVSLVVGVLQLPLLTCQTMTAHLQHDGCSVVVDVHIEVAPADGNDDALSLIHI